MSKKKKKNILTFQNNKLICIEACAASGVNEISIGCCAYPGVNKLFVLRLMQPQTLHLHSFSLMHAKKKNESQEKETCRPHTVTKTQHQAE